MSATRRSDAVHLTVADLTDCRALADRSNSSLVTHFRAALARAGASIVRETSHDYPGQGLTCVLVLEESHAVLHTWPERGTVHLDIFSCTGSLDARRAIDEVARVLQAGEVSVADVPRRLAAPAGRTASTAPPPVPSPGRFVLRALAASVTIFGVTRLPWVEQHVLWPFTTAQAHAARWAGGGPDTLARVGLSCSGAEAIGLVAGVILAWPATGWARLRGALLGALLLVLVNIVRITHLVRIDDLDRFTLMHETVWPAVLALVALGYVAAWMARTGALRPAPRTRTRRRSARSPLVRLVTAAGIATVAFFGASPWYLHSAAVAALAEWMAGAAAAVLHVPGAQASTVGPVLLTARGAFMVTSECIMTPVLPVGVAAALTLPRRWRARLAGVVAMVPVFVALGVARLLVLALPEAVAASPVLWVHAFFQMLLAVVIVAAAAAWRARGHAVRWPHVCSRAGLAVTCGVAVATVLGPVYAEAVERTAGMPLRGLDDQGAFLLMPAFQLGLLVALAVAVAARWSVVQWAGALLVMATLQVAVVVMAGLQGPDRPWPVPGVRAWAVLLPLLLLFVVPRLRRGAGRLRYQRFWERVGTAFPDLGGAASTDLYRANEQRLFREHLAPLAGTRVLKTDLWDEARNTRILQWAEGQGARVFGVDISLPTVRLARQGFAAAPLGATGADCRRLPFPDAQFDAIYSMGTIEHFDDSDVAVAEMFRVLAPGGRAIIGVPNRLDPFLRPALVWVMQRVGLYDYGQERSFTRAQLRRLLEAHGFEVVAEDAILFLPGWLRMLDLACHAWCPALTPATRALIAPFAWLDRAVPAVRRHGYLLATVVTKRDDADCTTSCTAAGVDRLP